MGVDSEIFKQTDSLGLTIAQVPIHVNYDVPNPSKKNMAFHFLDVFFSLLKFSSFRHPMLFYGLPSIIFLLWGIFYGIQLFSQIQFEGVITPLILAKMLVTTLLLLIGLVLGGIALILFTLVSLVRRSQQ